MPAWVACSAGSGSGGIRADYKRCERKWNGLLSAKENPATGCTAAEVAAEVLLR
jgi:hypothetical protein